MKIFLRQIWYWDCRDSSCHLLTIIIHIDQNNTTTTLHLYRNKANSNNIKVKSVWNKIKVFNFFYGKRKKFLIVVDWRSSHIREVHIWHENTINIDDVCAIMQAKIHFNVTITLFINKFLDEYFETKKNKVNGTCISNLDSIEF